MGVVVSGFYQERISLYVLGFTLFCVCVCVLFVVCEKKICIIDLGQHLGIEHCISLLKQLT